MSNSNFGLDIKGFTMIEAIFFILIIATLLSAFSHTYLAFIKKQPQLLSESNVNDLAISCSEIILSYANRNLNENILESKGRDLCERLFDNTPYSFQITKLPSDRHNEESHLITIKNKQNEVILTTLEFPYVDENEI